MKQSEVVNAAISVPIFDRRRGFDRRNSERIETSAEAYQRGYETAIADQNMRLQEMRIDYENRLSMLERFFFDGLNGLRGDSAEGIGKIITALAPALIRTFAAHEVKKLTGENGQRDVHLTAHEDLISDLITVYGGRLPAFLENSCTVDNTLNPGEFRMQWKGGTAIRDPQGFIDAILSELDRAIRD